MALCSLLNSLTLNAVLTTIGQHYYGNNLSVTVSQHSPHTDFVQKEDNLNSIKTIDSRLFGPSWMVRTTTTQQSKVTFSLPTRAQATLLRLDFGTGFFLTACATVWQLTAASTVRSVHSVLELGLNRYLQSHCYWCHFQWNLRRQVEVQCGTGKVSPNALNKYIEQ